MDQVCIVLPILPGKSNDARAFHRELESTRKADYDRSERRLGISKEVWYLASQPTGDQLVVYIEGANFNTAMQQFVASKNDFDLWFKRRLLEVTGLDLNNPPPDMKWPEMLSRFEA
jgi:hypothetical protein